MKKIILFIITFIIIITVINIINRNKNQETKVTTIQQVTTPSPTTQTLKYDSSTDLEKELESIDPKVLDSDLNE